MAEAVKRLILLRHAKSTRKDLGLPDFERPLAPRGRRAAALVAEHLRREPVPPPALVLCSPAWRTRETLDLVAPALGENVQVRMEPDLYDASEQRLLDCLRAVEEGVESVMLVGHNPSLEQLALGLAGGGRKLEAARRKFPTGALATLEFSGSWRELRPGGAELTDFVTPRQLDRVERRD